ncbi:MULTISPECIES: TetR/AcrR family transcriptional regulator [unclassified Amycolatopsis]|uniref:TetR/AcrR family transcriptional regulator n=1 Tax=unclassified Amycolatopsis TaxID=2618356 RepID=UPI002E107210|nr:MULTISPECIES: TetR/AcrR family transcriptional regulator [unclassified Amycolatopsis]WSJ80284.1 TetR/AcrR family transcriptional regulator [Amycolatopsis sp. NBC_01307]WSK76234.1 TetR/AcrR family transcriptional regulator [Amycolatopsis sp. NBC_01286]
MTKVDGRAARWAGQQERRRAEFVDAALEAIAEHGPDVSTEQIAERAGVARTRLYRHFDGAPDLQRAIAQRAAELVTADLQPLWHPSGSPREMIDAAISTHLHWLTEHAQLHRYLVRTLPSLPEAGRTDVRGAIARHLSRLFTGYLAAFGLDPAPADTIAFGLVGYVESATTRWLDHPGSLSLPQLTAQLTGTIWAMLDHTLRAGGVELDADSPLPLPDGLS